MQTSKREFDFQAQIFVSFPNLPSPSQALSSQDSLLQPLQPSNHTCNDLTLNTFITSTNLTFFSLFVATLLDKTICIIQCAGKMKFLTLILLSIGCISAKR